MKARGPRRTFQKEFKKDAVSLVVNKGYSKRQATNGELARVSALNDRVLERSDTSDRDTDLITSGQSKSAVGHDARAGH